MVAVTVALSPAAFHALAPLYAAVARSAPGSLAVLSAARWLAALLIVIVPTTAMGATLPPLSRLLPSSTEAADSALRERRLGALYASNTAGGALGALLAAYAILPALGMSTTVWASALGSATIGGLEIYFGARAPLPLQLASAAVSGVHNAKGIVKDALIAYAVAIASGALVFAAEVIFTHLLALIIGNGKFQGNTGWEMHAQRFFAHYPSIFVNKFDQALIIGLGTGTTLGTIAAYPWQKLDLVEVSPAMVEAADQYFQSVNNGAIHDPRLTLHLGDGRNFCSSSSGVTT